MRHRKYFDKAKSVAILLGLLFFGLTIIGIAGHVMNPSSALSQYSMYIGKALLVGAVIEFAFVLNLINDITSRIDERLTATSDNVIDSVKMHLSSSNMLSETGIISVTSGLKNDDVITDIRKTKTGPRVDILQSHVFSVNHFLPIIRAFADKNTLTKPAPAAENHQHVPKLRLLIGNPTCNYVIDRFLDNKKGVEPSGAIQTMSSQLDELYTQCQADTDIKRLMDKGTIELHLYSCRAAMSVYRVNEQWRVGWFPLTGWCIHAPHVHCKHPDARKKTAHTLAGRASSEFDYMWHNSVPYDPLKHKSQLQSSTQTVVKIDNDNYLKRDSEARPN